MAAARAALASSLSRLSSRSPPANLAPRRGLAGAADHHGPPRINIWEDPMSPSKWKEEHREISVGRWDPPTSNTCPEKAAVPKLLELTRGFTAFNIIAVKFVLASLSGWGLLIYGGFKAFGGKNDKKDEVIPAAAS